MLATATTIRIWNGGLKLAAIFVGLKLPVGAGITSNIESRGDVAMHVANLIGQTIWSVLNACMVGQMVHAVGALLASGYVFDPVHAVAGIVGHELFARLVSFALQVLS
jgi:hypothetical protein